MPKPTHTHTHTHTHISSLLKRLWNFLTHHNAPIIALEIAIFMGVVFVLAAPELMNNEQGAMKKITAKLWSPESANNEQGTVNGQQPIADSKLDENQELEIKKENLEELKIKEVGSQKFAFKTLNGDIIEIGVKEHSTPIPYAKLNRWDGECSLSISLPTDAQKTLQLEDGKVKWIEDKREVHMYPLVPREYEENGQIVRQYEQGGFEFEVFLKEKPTSNKIVLNIETKGLKFYYQPELTQEEKDKGVFSPENVVGSYAVYHETQDKFFKTKREAEKYKTGKAFHIYRPKIIDSNYWEVWGELNIDEKAGTLTVTIPQEFIDNAKYPVRHVAGTTFGYETIATHAQGPEGTENKIEGTQDVAPIDGTIQSISAYLDGEPFYDAIDVKCALYDAGTGGYQAGGTFLAETEEKNIGIAADWYTFNFSTPPSVTEGTYYYIVFWQGPGDHKFYYESATGWTQLWLWSVTYNGWPSSYNGSEDDTNYATSVYCTYTPAAAERRIIIIE